MERRNREAGFLDLAVSELGGRRSGELLGRLDAAIDWNQLAAPVRALAEYQNQGPGRPSWSAVVMLKGLMLQRWFNLSDPQLEEQLYDRLSFRRFVGLSLDDQTPDETTFVNFRNRLREADLLDRLCARVMSQLQLRDMVVREGTIVDATIIQQSRGDKRPDGTSTRDPDASFTKKHGQSHHGYKAHLAVDQSGLIVGHTMSGARDHDSKFIDELTRKEKKAVIADSAYSDESRRRRLRRKGVIDAIVYRRVRGQEQLHDWQERWNLLVSRVRAKVEHVMARLKHQAGWRRVRYRGLSRNHADLSLRVMAHNIKWSLSLSG